jgi:hypothetical protein
MDDNEIVARVNALAEEEHSLYTREADGAADDNDRQRLRDLEVSLDQCWDLLRQRRARRDAGLDPDDAAVRDAGTVEGYIG